MIYNPHENVESCSLSLLEECPNTEFFMARIFPIYFVNLRI